MKAFLVLLSLSAVAFASLEPAGYRPPGTSSQYLPPHLQRAQHQSQHQSHQSEAASPLTATSNQYLPPSYSRAAPVASPQYLPPQSQQQPPLPRPSSNYLPATDKPVLPSLPPAPPSNEYLPPAPSSEYLPPMTRTQPAKEYLPVQVPSNEYLPPVPKNEYLPATALSKKPAASQVLVAPKGDYLLPAARQNPPIQSPAPATPTGRISVISVSPFKLDGPAYSKSQHPQKQQQQQQQQQHLQGKFSGAGLATSATSSPVSGYPSRNPGLAVKGYEQPADNYLPPLSSGASEDYDTARSGYRYGAAGAAGPLRAAEQSTEPAKYDFEYRVSDEFGNDYAHKESRDGSQTQGVYSVLLPDGRKQIVRYEADENGFKPRISYEEAATVLGSKAPDAAAFAGYDGNANGLESSGPY